MKISAILCTARADYPVTTAPDWHVLGGPLACLEAQTFRDFEWIIVDLGHHHREAWLSTVAPSFPVRHVPIAPNYWTAHGRRARAHSLNTGIAEARGELIALFDDGWTFPPDWLERMWHWHERGAAVASLYKTARAPGEPAVWNDGREQMLLDGVCQGGGPGWPPTYGGLSVSAKAARAVGGYETLMDAGWGLEDIEFGRRLQSAGYPVVLDARVYIVAHPTGPLLGDVIHDDRNTLCCENLLRWKIDRIGRGILRADEPMGDADRARFLPRCVYLQPDQSCGVYGPGHPCSQGEHVRHPDPTHPDVRRALWGEP